MAKAKIESPTQAINTIATPDATVPKVCTLINFAVTQNKQVIITMLYGEKDSTAMTLIDRIAIDVDHAKRVLEVLNKVIKEAENEHS